MTVALVIILGAVAASSLALAAFAMRCAREATSITAEQNKTLTAQLVALTNLPAARQMAKPPAPLITPEQHFQAVEQQLRDMDPDYLLIGQDGGV